MVLFPRLCRVDCHFCLKRREVSVYTVEFAFPHCCSPILRLTFMLRIDMLCKKSVTVSPCQPHDRPTTFARVASCPVVATVKRHDFHVESESILYFLPVIKVIPIRETTSQGSIWQQMISLILALRTDHAGGREATRYENTSMKLPLCSLLIIVFVQCHFRVNAICCRSEKTMSVCRREMSAI